MDFIMSDRCFHTYTGKLCLEQLPVKVFRIVDNCISFYSDEEWKKKVIGIEEPRISRS